MRPKKNIFAIIGSASEHSANQKLVEALAISWKNEFEFKIFNDLKTFPHFDPRLSADNPPATIQVFRNNIETADGVLICSPEYVFSIPSGLKNAIEWCVAATVFSNKPTGLITASADGQKGHEELQLIMTTLMARFTDETTLLIRGIKGKINAQGEITDAATRTDLAKFSSAFQALVTGRRD